MTATGIEQLYVALAQRLGEGLITVDDRLRVAVWRRST
jgi:predicted nucleic acid-binding protein